MQQPIRFSERCPSWFCHWLSARDISLSLAEFPCEGRPSPETLTIPGTLDWLQLSDTMFYHRQLFLWRLYSVLWMAQPSLGALKPHPFEINN